MESDDAGDRSTGTAAHAAQPEAANSGQKVVLRFGDARTGTLVGMTADGTPLIDFPGNPSLGHLRARTCVDVQRRDLGREVVLLFEEGDWLRPIVVGCLRTGQQSQPTQFDSAQDVPVSDTSTPGTLRISTLESLTLHCGAASITLTGDGKVLINGTYVQSRALGTQRIQGGSVQIN